MTKIRLFLLCYILGTLPATAASETLYFALETAVDTTRISLTIEGDQVSGTQSWQPKKEAHGARGSISGILTDGGIMKVVHEFTMEGSDVAEEQVYKLDGDRLLIGEGELVEGEAGRLKLTEPNKVSFKKILKRVVVTEPKPGTPERKAIMEAMRDPVAREIGQPVTFTGSIQISGGWARFAGDVIPADGKPVKNEDAAASLELDFFSLLHKTGKGEWRVRVCHPEFRNG